MTHPQISVTFYVATDHDGRSHVMYRSILAPLGRRVGGRTLPQYSGVLPDMERLAKEMQAAYNNDCPVAEPSLRDAGTQPSASVRPVAAAPAATVREHGGSAAAGDTP